MSMVLWRKNQDFVRATYKRNLRETYSTDLSSSPLSHSYMRILCGRQLELKYFTLTQCYCIYTYHWERSTLDCVHEWVRIPWLPVKQRKQAIQWSGCARTASLYPASTQEEFCKFLIFIIADQHLRLLFSYHTLFHACIYLHTVDWLKASPLSIAKITTCISVILCTIQTYMQYGVSYIYNVEQYGPGNKCYCFSICSPPVIKMSSKRCCRYICVTQSLIIINVRLQQSYFWLQPSLFSPSFII
jgi:hypothetical protein